MADSRLCFAQFETVVPLSEAITVKGKMMVKVAMNYDANAFANNVFIFIIIYMQFFVEGGSLWSIAQVEVGRKRHSGQLAEADRRGGKYGIT